MTPAQWFSFKKACFTELLSDIIQQGLFKQKKNESTICNEAYDIDDFHLTYIQFFENTYLNHLSQTPPFNNISTTKLYFLKAQQKQIHY